MIRQIVEVTVPGFALGAIFMALANQHVAREIAGARWLKLAVFFAIVHGVLLVAAIGHPWVAALVLAIVSAGAVELRRAWEKISQPRPARIWLAFFAVAILSLWASWLLPPNVFAFLFLVTAASDGFSQVVGQLFGRHKLAPRVSPAKTIEGLGGGLIAAMVVALLAHDLLGVFGPAGAAALALVTGLAGLVGDLCASWVKRRACIKDFSAALPGQGGFLDRFDSLLGALALVGTAFVLVSS